MEGEEVLEVEVEGLEVVAPVKSLHPPDSCLIGLPSTVPHHTTPHQ